MKQKVYRKQSPGNTTIAAKTPAPKAREESKPPRHNVPDQKGTRYLGIALCSITLLAFLFLWVHPVDVRVEDPWTKAGKLVNEAANAQQPLEKQRLLSKAHLAFLDLVRQHPYHARLWYIYGFYFMQTQQWDSVVACNKKAIELGKGGTVNQVEYSAADNLCYGLSMQFNDPAFKNNGAAILQNAEVPGFTSPCLLKLQGAYYTNRNRPDSALAYLKQAIRFEKSPDVYYNIAINFYNKQRSDSAIFYLKEALKVKPDYQQASDLLKQISNTTK